MKTLKILTLLTLMVGFQRDQAAIWDIDKDDPSLWVKFCSDIYDQEFKSGDVPSGDELKGKSLEVADVITSILDDFNNLPHSYLKIDLYPEDKDSPPTAEANHSQFTKNKSKNRTIDICIQSTKNPLEGGHAQTIVENGKRIKCKIVLASSAKDKYVSFVRTITHEIGHCVGLAHNHNVSTSVMSYFASEDIIRLGADDRAGITSFYPKKAQDHKEQPNFGLSCTYRK